MLLLLAHMTGVPYTLAKLAICYCILHIGCIILVPGLSNQFLPYFPIQPAFEVSTLVSNIFRKWLHDFVS